MNTTASAPSPPNVTPGCSSSESANTAVAVAVNELAGLGECFGRVNRFSSECPWAEVLQADRDTFDSTEGWRENEVVRLQGRLDEHWADVAVTCAKADDPLAYGVDVLRHGLAHHTERLEVLNRQIPPGRSHEFADARRDLREAIDDRAQARQDLTRARERLEEATASRWRTRPVEAAAAQTDVDAALLSVRAATATEVQLRPVVEQLAEHQHSRRSAVEATADERHDLAVNCTVIREALAGTLESRVQAVAQDPSEHLTRALGPVPETDNGRAVWCQHARALENLVDIGHVDQANVRPDHLACRDIAKAHDPDSATPTLPRGSLSAAHRATPDWDPQPSIGGRDDIGLSV